MAVQRDRGRRPAVLAAAVGGFFAGAGRAFVAWLIKVLTDAEEDRR
jgi:hypothetical protein